MLGACCVVGVPCEACGQACVRACQGQREWKEVMMEHAEGAILVSVACICKARICGRQRPKSRLALLQPGYAPNSASEAMDKILAVNGAGVKATSGGDSPPCLRWRFPGIFGDSLALSSARDDLSDP